MASQPPAVRRADLLRRGDQALAPIDGLPRLDLLRTALRQPGPTIVDFAWLPDVSQDHLATTARWAGAAPEHVLARQPHPGRETVMDTEWWFRPLRLDRVRALDLEEPAPAAVVAVTTTDLDAPARDRLGELAAQCAGVPLLLVMIDPPDGMMPVGLAAPARWRLVTRCSGAFSHADLAEALGLADAAGLAGLRVAAEAATAQRLLTAAQCLLIREQRRCEGEMLRLSRSSDAGLPGDDPFAPLATEVTGLKPRLSSFFEARFADAARVFVVPALPDGDLPATHDASLDQTLYAAPEHWLARVRTDAETAAAKALHASLQFATLRVQTFAERTGQIAAIAGMRSPTPAPTLDRVEFGRIVADRVGGLTLDPERAPRRTMMSFVTRNNPLAIISPILPALGLFTAIAPDHLFPTKTVAASKQQIGAVVMGMGALFYMISLASAPLRRRTALAEDRQRARAKLAERMTESVRKALIELGTRTANQAARRAEAVSNWFADARRPGPPRAPAPGGQLATVREQALRSRHRELGNRLRLLADLPRPSP